MKFSILINQRVIAEQFPDLDLADAAILAFLSDCFASPRITTRTLEGETWWWIKPTWMAREMPLLGINTRQGILKRVNRLRDAGLLETTVADGNISMMRPGPKWDILSGIDPTGNLPETPKKPGGGDNHGCGGVTTTVAGGDNHGCHPLCTVPSHKYQTMNTPLPPKGDFFKFSDEDGKPIPSKAKTNPDAPTEYPADWQENAAFAQAFSDYLTVRRQKRQTATPTTRRLLQSKLTRYSIGVATEALRKSAEHGWTGVFPESIAPAVAKPKTNETGLDLF